MWNAIRNKLFHLFGAKIPDSEFLKLAKKKGLLTEEQLAEAEKLLQANPEETSQDLLVDHDLLSNTDAEVIALERKERAPKEHIADTFKRANKAVSDTGAVHLSEVAAALAKKG